VSVALREKLDAVQRFADEFNIRFPLWIDADENGPPAFGVRAHPNTILIDREGRIVGRVLGERQWNSRDAHRLVEALLGGGR